MEVGRLKFTWKIENFSNIQIRRLCSDVFSLGPYKWRIVAYPKGSHVDRYLSIFLEVADSETLPSGWSRSAKFSFTLMDQVNNKLSFTKSDEPEFDAVANNWGFRSFISHKELNDPEKGFLVNDTCIIEADVTTYRDASLGSHRVKKETSKEDPTKNASEQVMEAFFGDLQSVISAKKVPSWIEAKQALSIIDEALNMVPSDLNNPAKTSQLATAFDVLSSSAGCSRFESDQKAEWISMKNNFIALLDRAAEAVKGMKLFPEKDLLKKTLDSELGKCLSEFEKAKSETVHNKQMIHILQRQVDSLLAQIGEMKKKEADSLLKQKETFKLSKELKEELDVLVKNWPAYEAKR